MEYDERFIPDGMNGFETECKTNSGLYDCSNFNDFIFASIFNLLFGSEE